MTEIRIDVSNVEGALEKIERATKGDRRDLLEAIGDAVSDVVDRHFDDKKDPDGAPWEPWSESYKNSGQGVALLERTGRLRGSIRRGKTGGRSARIGTRVEYGGTHQHGSRRRNIPRRSFLGWGEDEAIAAEAIAIDWLERQLV